MRLVLFGGSYADPLHNPSDHAWMHKLVSLLGGNSTPIYDGKHVMLYSNNRPIGQHTDFGDIISYACQGCSIEYSQAQFLYYLKHEYLSSDIIIFVIPSLVRLPFIGNTFKKEIGYGHNIDYNDKDFEKFLYYLSDDDLKLKVDLIATIMNGLENRKVLLNSIDDVPSDFDFHLSGTLYTLSNTRRYSSDRLAMLSDKRSNHLPPWAALELAERLYDFLM